MMALVCLAAVGARRDDGATARRARSRAYLLEGQRQMALQNYDDGFALINKAYLTDTTNAEAAISYGTIVGPVLSNSPADSVRFSRILANAAPLADKYPGDMFPMLTYSGMLGNVGDMKQAIDVLERLRELNPDDTRPLESLVDMHLDNGGTDRALELLEDYRRIQGEDVQTSLRVAGIYLTRKDTTAMLDEFRRLIATNPRNPEYWNVKGKIENFLGMNDSALVTLKKAQQLSPEGDGVSKILLVDVYRALGDSVNAEKMTYEAIRAEDINYQAKQQLVRENLITSMRSADPNARKSNDERIYSLLALLLKQYPNEPEILETAWQYSMYRHKYATALEYAGYRLDQSPSEEASRDAITTAYFAKDYDKMDEFYRDALVKWAPLSPDISIMYAEILMATDRFDKAETIVDSLMRDRFPDIDPDAPLDISRLDRNITEEQLDNLIQLFRLKGDIAFNKKSTARMGQSYANALMLEPSNALVLNNYAYFLVKEDGNLTEENLAKALQMSEKAVALEPHNATYLDTRAWTLYRSGDCGKALQVMQEALKYAESNAEAQKSEPNSDSEPDEDADEGNSEFYDHLGDILSCLGRTDEAIENWKKALEIKPDDQDIRTKYNKAGGQ